MTELYTIQRYLQHDRLQEMGMGHFDCWASRFGETTTALELAPEGTGYRARTRFAKFFNLPELMNLFKEVADIKTADQLHLPTPEVAYHTIATKPTQIQQDMVKALSERASKVHSGAVSPDVDNMLKITSDGRKLGLDQRIINPMLPDEETTKVNQCVANILQYWRDGEADKLTQLVFCDISTPKTAPLSGRQRLPPVRWTARKSVRWRARFHWRKARKRRSRSMRMCAKSSLTPVCPRNRSRSSTMPTRRSKSGNCSQRYAAVKCAS